MTNRAHSKPQYPEAAVIDAFPNRDHPEAIVVSVRCPLCRSAHTHGLPDSAPGVDGTFGHRAAHCGAAGGYVLTDPAELIAGLVSSA